MPTNFLAGSGCIPAASVGDCAVIAGLRTASTARGHTGRTRDVSVVWSEYLQSAPVGDKTKVTATGWAGSPFALELEYTRTLYGEKIAIASIDEIKKLGIGTNTQHEQWLTDMKKIFPNVEEGQQLTGIFTPGQPSRFFFNGKPIGDIADPEFGPAFFGIWLHPKTSAPKLRQVLLNTK